MKRTTVLSIAFFGGLLAIVFFLLFTNVTKAQEPTPASRATGVVPTETVAKLTDVLHTVSSERNQVLAIVGQLQGRIRFLEHILQGQFQGDSPNDGPPPPPADESQTLDLTPSILKPDNTTSTPTADKRT